MANYCLKLKWRRPLASQLRGRLLEICKKEGFEQVDTQTIEKIVESCHGDMRQILNLLQSWRLRSKNLTYSDVVERMQQDGKTFEEMNIFELAKSLFTVSIFHLFVGYHHHAFSAWTAIESTFGLLFYGSGFDALDGCRELHK